MDRGIYLGLGLWLRRTVIANLNMIGGMSLDMKSLSATLEEFDANSNPVRSFGSGYGQSPGFGQLNVKRQRRESRGSGYDKGSRGYDSGGSL